MSLPEQIDAYPDCQRLFEIALRDTVGARACFANKSLADLFQMRMHKYRSLDRAQARRVYTKDHLLYGKSEFDQLIVQCRASADDSGEWWVLVKRRGAEILAIETLSNEAVVDLAEFHEQPTEVGQ